MNDLPEPLGNIALICVAFDESAVLLPSIEIKYSWAANQLFKFLRSEELSHQVLIAHFVEPSFERSKLVFALLLEHVVHIKIHVFLSVLLVHEYFCTTCLQLYVHMSSKILNLDGERHSESLLKGCLIIVVEDEF